MIQSLVAKHHHETKDNYTYEDKGTTVVVLNGKTIIRHVPTSRHVQFDTQGIFSDTVRIKMNQVMTESGVPLYVFTSGREWFVRNTRSGHVLPFSGSMCIMGY